MSKNLKSSDFSGANCVDTDPSDILDLFCDWFSACYSSGVFPHLHLSSPLSSYSYRLTYSPCSPSFRFSICIVRPIVIDINPLDDLIIVDGVPYHLTSDSSLIISDHSLFDILKSFVV